jgi:histidine phosphotransferase ChpT
MGQRANPTDLELAALISSKICHDVIGPVGAIYNGLEILDEDDDQEAKNYALDVIRNVTEQASARLQFARFAFGAAGSAGAMIDLGTAEQISRGFIGKGKHNLTWRTVPGHMAKDKVKLLLNLVASAITALPRGGDIEVQMAGTLDNPSFLIRLPRAECAAAPAPHGVHCRRAPAAARCHDHPGLLHVAAGEYGRHAPCRAAGRRRRPPLRQATGLRRNFAAPPRPRGCAARFARRYAERQRG